MGPLLSSMPLSRTRCCSLVLAAAVLGCDSPPVEWQSDTIVPAGGAGVTLTANGRVDAAASAAPMAVQGAGVACRASTRYARAGSTVYAVWWAPRADSMAYLMSSRSADGGVTWSTPAAVDTTDHGPSGCNRPAASIAADSASGYVHVAYGLVGAEGPGIFFAHSMDQGRTFHTPVPILYGEHLGLTSVSASGDNVAVAFEDPNSTAPRIGLALSHTMGHIFENRVVPVSDDHGSAVEPLVAVGGSSIAVAWRERGSKDASLRVRVGRLR